MQISFEDGSYVEILRSNIPGKIIITVAAKQLENPLETIINSVEINEKQFYKLISDILQSPGK